jgi:hypothetical protein
VASRLCIERHARIIALLGCVRELLQACGERSWADALSDLAARQASEDVCSEIRRRYGGMGSLNDIVLHSTDIARMKADNSQFGALRSELFKLCQ